MKRKKYQEKIEKGFLGCGRPNLRLMQKINEYIISHNLTQELDPHRSMKRNLVNMKCDANIETESRETEYSQKVCIEVKNDEMCDFL